MRLNKKLDVLQQCISDIRLWMKCNELKLNDDKTELMVFSKKQHLAEYQQISISIGCACVTASEQARNLGVVLESMMTLDKHVSDTCSKTYVQLRNIGRIRRYLDMEATKTLVHALVISRLDYGNALLHGLPNSTINRLQRVQNVAARMITRTKRRDHITPVLCNLHWLPIERRVQYKVSLFVFRALNNLASRYISDMLERYVPPRVLRSKDLILLKVPPYKLKGYGLRSFSVSAPRLWNALPYDVRKITVLPEFKSKPIPYLFATEFGHINE